MKTIVIGGGLLGLSTAYVLLERGHQVTVLETCENVGMEASHKNGGILTPSMSDPWNAPGVFKHLASSVFDSQAALKLHVRQLPSLLRWGLDFLRHSKSVHYRRATMANYRLAAYSVEKTRELRERLNLDYNASTQGTLKLFRRCEAMQASEALAESLSPMGLCFNKLDVDGVIAIEPQLSGIKNQIAGALHFPDDECGDAHLFCLQLAEKVRQGGGSIHTGVSVKRLIACNGKIDGVETSQEVTKSDQVIVAAGVHSSALLKPLKVILPVKPAKGYSITLGQHSISTLVRDLLPQMPVIDDAMHAAVIPLGNCLRLVGTAEFAGFDKRLCQNRIDNLFNILKQLYPHLASHIDLSLVETWAGLRPMSADGKPYIGPTQIKGLFLNTGHGHLGWTMAVGSAYLLADQMEGKQSVIDSAPYGLNRRKHICAV